MPKPSSLKSGLYQSRGGTSCNDRLGLWSFRQHRSAESKVDLSRHSSYRDKSHIHLLDPGESGYRQGSCWAC